MADVLLDQALFGYDRGHRLLASSIDIDTSAGRLLRRVTDTAFDGLSGQYLTVLPIPSLRRQAVIRSWPAGVQQRSGSVWSHVLFIALPDLEQLDELAIVTTLFRNPEQWDELELAYYEQPLPLHREGRYVHQDERIDRELAYQIIEAVYGTNQRDWVAVDQPQASEEILLEMWAQQWPRLRCEFSFRTRRRASDGSTLKFAIEVVERGPRPNAVTSDHHRLDWATTLVDDLEVPKAPFRKTLRVLGGDSDERTDLPVVVELIKTLQGEDWDAAAVVGQIAGKFPEPEQMINLKRTLLGRVDPDSPPLLGWPRDEAVRLGLVIHQEDGFVNPSDLDLEERLGELWRSRPREARLALSDVCMEALTPELREAVTQATADYAPVRELVRLARSSPGVVRSVVRLRPAVLTVASGWDDRDKAYGDLAMELFDTLDTDGREDVFVALIARGQEAAATEIASYDPSLWWRGLMRVALGASTQRDLVDRSRLLARVLADVGPASVGPRARGRPATTELLAMATGADLRTGLWRQAPAGAWIELAEAFPPADGSLPGEKWRKLEVRISTIALVASGRGTSSRLRKRAWLAGASVVHEALLADTLEEDVRLTLDRNLLRGDGTPPERFRRVLAKEITRNGWTTADVEALLTTLEPYRDEIVRMLRARQRRKKGGDWLKDLIDHIVR